MDVLILDDDQDLREVLTEAVGQLGSRAVALASYGELVAKRDQALGCRLAILDVNLGSGSRSGVDAATWLRAQGFSGAITFLTGHGRDHPDVRRAAEEPNTRLISKPISIGALRELLAAPLR
jgi:DNA-binding response OmpR family regulator